MGVQVPPLLYTNSMALVVLFGPVQWAVGEGHFGAETRRGVRYP